MYYKFSCNWDTTVIFTTVVTLLITVAVIFLSFKTYTTYRSRGKNFMAIIAITAVWILPIAGIVSFMYMPTSVTVDDEKLILRQIKGDITIPISEIIEAKQICPDDMKDGVRRFGSGGLFGYLGWFENPRLGKFLMYATNKNNRFLVKDSRNTYVFSCVDSDVVVGTILKVATK